MDRIDDVGTDKNLLTCDLPDDALECAAGRAEGQAWTLNFCTYTYYQCGPIGLALRLWRHRTLFSTPGLG